jgi:Flp pilus assembly protein TadG
VSAIEFSLVLTVLLALLLGLVDWSWFMVQYLDVGVAVGRGARIVAGDSADPQGVAATTVCAVLAERRLDCDPSDVSVTAQSDGSGQTWVVSYQRPFRAPVGLVPTPEVVAGSASSAWYGYLYQ